MLEMECQGMLENVRECQGMLRNAWEVYLIDFKRIFQNWLEKENLLIVRIARKSRDQKFCKSLAKGVQYPNITFTFPRRCHSSVAAHWNHKREVMGTISLVGIIFFSKIWHWFLQILLEILLTFSVDSSNFVSRFY